MPKCKYCGREFSKKANKQLYCCDQCRKLALKEQKARYQRSRRKKIRDGILVSNETRYVGTGFLSSKRKEDFQDELDAIMKEMKRLRINGDKL